MRGDEGQGGERPFAAFYLRAFGRAYLQQVTDRRGNDKLFTLEVISLLGETAQCLGNIRGHTRLFRNYQRFSHSINGKLCPSTDNFRRRGVNSRATSCLNDS